MLDLIHKLKEIKGDRALLSLMAVALVFHVCVALAASRIPELGDESSFKDWANQSVDLGIHKAYEFGYDWLPFYLYLSKLVGLTYRVSGLYDHFGAHSSALTFLLKIPMIFLNLVIAWLIYQVVHRLDGDHIRSLWGAAAYLFNPAIVLATDVFGYQDAFHTALVFLSAFCLCSWREGWSPVWASLAFLTKPQAAIFLLPIGAFLFLKKGVRGLFKGLASGAITALVVLIPFIASGRMLDVTEMYLDVPLIHQWLTGCAHNIWWVFWPVPPFRSDRVPLLLGLNGLTIGLILLAAFSIAVILCLFKKPSPLSFLHLCAFLGFAFFMVTTQIHENHLYAMFSFLSVFVALSLRLRWIYIGLTVTFALDLVLSLWLLNTGAPFMVGPIRVSILNALANVVILGFWSVTTLGRNLPDPAFHPAFASPRIR